MKNQNDDDIILNWQNVSYSARSSFGTKKIPILHNINIQLNKSTTLALIGSNGAGKTTTLLLGAGVLRPTCGSVFLYNTPVSDIPVKKRLGFLAEIQHSYKNLKLNEWLSMLGQLSGIEKKTLTKRIDILIDLLELKTLYKRGLKTFSKGQLQRASLAQAILHDPDVLILDEPMSGLDSYWRYHFTSFLKYFKSKGGSIIFSSHVLTDIEEIADYVAFIEKGTIKWKADVSDFAKFIHHSNIRKDFKRLESVTV
ncbi:putative Sulfate-transporting ATPase [Desulfamplus magnetovallimortis]|uniref:Putative Sulfate-transporting ATPase n=1 Tax=Desulfamplus magnetovallimortis TaxID=1246637 RepID=A0A1W1HLC8_9BACT|nr:ABC transporter ATP-binding protein [Desulfamplus magnetovallimortis]SLM33158.1 putative Sulfate-transporting ATPase [Desulfamplus magnetovallimortis]